MSARRALVSVLLPSRAREARQAGGAAPPVFWGRIGAYEGVTRQGVLVLLSPEAGHPSRRATSGG